MARTMRYGTAYFRSNSDAIRYYAAYGYHRNHVLQKIADLEIHIGNPPLQTGETLEWDTDGRAVVIVTEGEV